MISSKSIVIVIILFILIQTVNSFGQTITKREKGVDSLELNKIVAYQKLQSSAPKDSLRTLILLHFSRPCDQGGTHKLEFEIDRKKITSTSSK